MHSGSDIEWIDFRDLTVGRSVRTGGSDRVSFLRIEGHWLRKAGFPVGSKVLVAVAEGRLLIEPKNSPMDLCFSASPMSVVAEGAVTPFLTIPEPIANPTVGLDAAVPTLVRHRSLRSHPQYCRGTEWIDFRDLTVGRSVSTGRSTQVPFLRLEGRWLWNAGFPIGSKVLVAVADGRLLIEQESPVMEIRLDASLKSTVPKKRPIAPSAGIVEHMASAADRFDVGVPTFVHDTPLRKKSGPK